MKHSMTPHAVLLQSSKHVQSNVHVSFDLHLLSSVLCLL